MLYCIENSKHIGKMYWYAITNKLYGNILYILGNIYVDIMFDGSNDNSSIENNLKYNLYFDSFSLQLVRSPY